MKNEVRNKNSVIYYLLWGLMAVVFFPVFRNLYIYRWDALGYTHAFFILPISIGLTYWKKEELVEADEQAAAAEVAAEVTEEEPADVQDEQ